MTQVKKAKPKIMFCAKSPCGALQTVSIKHQKYEVVQWMAINGLKKLHERDSFWKVVKVKVEEV